MGSEYGTVRMSERKGVVVWLEGVDGGQAQATVAYDSRCRG